MEYQRQNLTTGELAELELPKVVAGPPSEFRIPELVGSYRPVRSVVTSVVLHLIVVCLISIIRIVPKRNATIDFEKERITYYDVS